MPAENTQVFGPAVSDYERVGGAPAIKAVVDRFYEMVLGDDQLSGYFEGTDLNRLKRHQAQLVSQVMGGPATYEGRDLQQAHAPLQITADDFGVVVTYLAAAMQEAGVPGEIVARVGARLSDVKRDVVTSGAH